MWFFRSKAENELDLLLDKVHTNMANNYKDAAQSAYRDLIRRYGELCESGELKPSKRAFYESAIDSYKEKLQSFTHKDQKPYWT